MNVDFERKLREALRPEKLDASFAERVSRCVQEAPASHRMPAVTRSGRVWRITLGFLRGGGLSRRSMPWFAAGVCACLIAGFGLAHWRQQSLARARGARAQQQLREALSITAETLGTARKLVLRADGHDS